MTLSQLPVYVPNEDERKDPVLYANNVRQYMLKYSKLTPIESTFQDKLAYHSLLGLSSKKKSELAQQKKDDDAAVDRRAPTVVAKAI